MLLKNINNLSKMSSKILDSLRKEANISCYKRNNPSAQRNKQPILEVLEKVLDNKTHGLKLLEISSGTGQHSAYFSQRFPNITFQPSEYDQNMLPSILAYAQEAVHKNVKDPVVIDVSKPFEHWNLGFQEKEFDYMLNINMIHITPWACTEGLFQNASRLLKNKGTLVTYGPYAVDGVLVPESNVRFNNQLQSQNAQWGVRDLRDLKQLGKKHGILFVDSYDMPANNKAVVWVKNETET